MPSKARNKTGRSAARQTKVPAPAVPPSIAAGRASAVEAGPAPRLAGWRRAGLLLVPLAAIFVYLNSLGGDFVWDDRFLILENPGVQSFQALGQIFTKDYVFLAKTNLAYGYYRPITTLSLICDYHIWGQNPFGFHLTNVLIHALCALLVVRLSLRLGLGVRAALLCGLLFAVHPIHTESVAWISGRTDVLAFLFTALALDLHLAASTPARGSRRGLWALSMLFFALALLAKEMSVVLIAWVAWIHLLRGTPSLARALRAALPYLAVFGVYLLVRFGLFQVPPPEASSEYRLSYALLSAAPTVLRYLGWMAWPVPLQAYVQNPYVTGAGDLRFVAALLALAGLGFLIARLARLRIEVLLLSGLLLASFGPVLNLSRLSGPPDMGNMMAERFCYFPSFPFLALLALAFSELVDRVAGRLWMRRALSGALAVLVLAAGAQSVARNPDWKDDETFFRRSVEQTPAASLLWCKLARTYLRFGRLPEADQALRRAEALDPGVPSILSARAQWLVQSGRPAEALPLQEAAVRQTGKDDSAALNNLAHLYRVTGHPDRALSILQDLVARLDGYAEAFFNLGETERELGHLDPARAAYRRVLELDPDNLQVVQALASLEAGQGRPKEAEAIYLSALRRTREDAKILNNVGLLRLDLGDGAGALEAFEQAVRIDPAYPRARFNLARALHQAGRAPEAEAELEEIVRRAPGTEFAQAAARQLQDWREQASSRKDPSP
jgi:protein O-mannosyl-transferase